MDDELNQPPRETDPASPALRQTLPKGKDENGNDVEPYSYKALQTPSSIRLFRLSPANSPSEVLQGELLTSTLDECPDYEAVSYVWGSESGKRPMICDGSEIKITRNLAAALRRFQLPGNGRILWVDSICINQSDTQEKNQQVRLMGEIYKKARRVLVWLGEEDHGAEDTFKAFDCMVLLLHRVWPRRHELEKWLGFDRNGSSSLTERWEKLAAHFNIPARESIEFESLNRLLQRPWFTRAWTYQESFNAQNRVFHCGRYEFGDEWMNRVMTIMLYLFNGQGGCAGYFEPEGFLSVSTVLMIQSLDLWPPDSNAAMRLLVLLVHRRGSGCKDPRDLVYALVGIAAATAIIEIDYNQSFENVFATTTAHIIMHTGHLNVLSEVYHATGPTLLPSWVPDWRLIEKARSMLPISSSSPLKPRAYSSTGLSIALLKLSECPKEITLQGMYWDTIITTTAASGPGPDLDAWIQRYIAAFDNWYPASNEVVPLAVFRTQCRDLKIFDPREQDERWDSNSLLDMYYIMQQDKLLPALKLTFDFRLKDTLLAMTQKSYIGLVPDSARPGDAIAFLLGGEVPFILRRDPADGKYTFIGECYLHGFMDGEALIEARRKAQPDYDHSDTSWLNRLHEEDLPFPTTAFTIK